MAGLWAYEIGDLVRFVSVVPPRVVVVPRGTFRAWTRERGRLGGQNKVPRLRNDREVAEALLAAA